MIAASSAHLCLTLTSHIEPSPDSRVDRVRVTVYLSRFQSHNVEVSCGPKPDQRLQQGGKITAKGPIWIFAARRRTSFTMQTAHSNSWFWFWWAFQVLGPQTSLWGVENGFPATSPPRSFKRRQFIFSPGKSHRGTPPPQLPFLLHSLTAVERFKQPGSESVVSMWWNNGDCVFWEWVEERWVDVFSTAAADDRMVITAAGTIAAGYTLRRPWGESPLFWVIY